jgi:hypothetical protein
MLEYAPVYPESRKWTDTVKYLSEHESEIITELQKQFLEQGEFREPVVLKKFDSDDEIDELTTGKLGYVADGTHRLVSAYLLGVDFIEVSDGYDETSETDYFLATEVTSDDPKFFSDQYDDIFFDLLRSMCISDSIWITASTGSGSLNSASVYWDAYDPSLTSVINDAVIQRLESRFPKSSFTVKTFVESWDD